MRLKERIFAATKVSGAMAAVANSAWRQRRLLILCYHGVSAADEHEWNPELYIPQELLRTRLRFLLDEGYNVLPLAEGVQRLRDRTLPQKSVAITFDDGAYDFETRAVPVLRELGVPATVYLTTNLCGRPMPIFYTGLSYVLWKGRDSGADLSACIGSPSALLVATDAQRRAAFLAVRQVADGGLMNAAARHELLGRVASVLGVDLGPIVAAGLLQIMSAEQLRALPRDLVDIQLHTHRHRTPRVEAKFRREVEENRVRIRELALVLTPRVHFCYPDGDYAAVFQQWLEELGVESATTCVPGLATPRSPPLLLPRMIDTTHTPALTFEAWASGVADLLPRRAEHRLDPERA